LLEPFYYKTSDVEIDAIRLTWTFLPRKAVCFSVSTIGIMEVKQPDGGS
jgi:hypothetical protein